MQWWRWFSLADFASHLVRAIVCDQFYCTPAGSCPHVQLTTDQGIVSIPTYEFMSKLVGADYEDRWDEMGWAIFIMVLIMLSVILIHKTLNWQRR